MKIYGYIIGQRNDYDSKKIELPGGGKEFSQSEQIERNNTNWRSEYYEEGATDKIIGAYPYDNIIKPIILLEARSTDFDVKHIEIEPKSQNRESRVSAMIATKAVHRYARKHGLAKLLDDICFYRPKYGGVLVKKTKDGPVVVPWENVITDQTDIMSGVIIERHYYTPAELKRQKGWNNIDEAIENSETYKEADTDSGAKKNITQGNYIEVFELHGEIKRSILLEAQGKEYDDEDEKEYVRAFIATTAYETDKDSFDGNILYADTEDKSPYMYLARNPQVGRGLGESVYESLREHQKWHNYSKTEEVRMMAIAGKIVFITNQPNAITNLATNKVDHGAVLPLGADANGNPNFFQQLNQVPSGTPVYQNMREEWANSARLISSAHAAKMGEEAKAGTPFRAQYLQNVEASSQFEKYRKEIGEQLLRPMVEEWILPDACKELAAEDELYDTFSPQELAYIDETIINQTLARKVFEKSVARVIVTPEELDMMKQEVVEELRKAGSKRTITNIKKFIKDVDGQVVIHVTDEMRAKAVLFESYANLLQILAPEDPRRNAVIDRVMDSIGVTREELMMYSNEAMPGTPNPNQNPKLKMEEMKKEANLAANV